MVNKKSNDKRLVFCAMSGGVDSSVAAALLTKKGYEVIGVHLKCYNVDGCAEQDSEDARRAAEVLGIPFYVFDFEKEYKDRVVKYMIDGYRKGITPNPDVMCNKEIKFGLFLDKALEMGADYVATGHYVRLCSAHLPIGTSVRQLQRLAPPTPRSDFPPLVKPSKLKLRSCRTTDGQISSCHSLLIAKDQNKDQSYFLWTLTQKQLKHCLFPIGEYTKPEVRKLAKKFNLPNADKKDSQGICFLGRVKLADFLGRYIKPKVGQVKLSQPDGSSKVIGQHRGAYFYTIGQRNGLGIGGNKNPQYVIEKDVKRNLILIAESDNPGLYKKEIALEEVNFIVKKPINDKKVLARVRYRQPLVRARFCKTKGRHILVFDSSQKFIASGQSAVFYNKKGELLGGGIIA